MTVALAAVHARRRLLGPGGFAWRAIAWLLIAFIAAIVTASAIVPRLINAVPLTVLTGSMRPQLNPGDLVVVRPVTNANSIEVGDVVTFQPVSDDPALITHRVAAITRADGHVTSLVTRGDANGANDNPIVADQVRGTVAYSIPRVGWLSTWMSGGRAWIVTAGIVAAFGYAAYSFVRAGAECVRARRVR